MGLEKVCCICRHHERTLIEKKNNVRPRKYSNKRKLSSTEKATD